MVIFNMLAFYNLFREVGQQKCYQIKVEDPKTFNLDYNDVKKRHMGWRWATIFYAQAVPFTFIANFLYWIDYRKFIMSEDDYNLHFPFTHQQPPNVRDDMFLQLEIFNDKILR